MIRLATVWPIKLDDCLVPARGVAGHLVRHLRTADEGLKLPTGSARNTTGAGAGQHAVGVAARHECVWIGLERRTFSEGSRRRRSAAQLAILGLGHLVGACASVPAHGGLSVRRVFSRDGDKGMRLAYLTEIE